MVSLVLHIRHEKFVCVNVLTDAEKLVAVEVHVADVFVVVRQVTPSGEDELEAVVEESVLVECQDEPSQGLVVRLDIFKLTVYVGDTAPVGKIF